MFTDKAQAVIDLSKDYGYSNGASELNVSAMLTAAVRGMIVSEFIDGMVHGWEDSATGSPQVWSRPVADCIARRRQPRWDRNARSWLSTRFRR